MRHFKLHLLPKRKSISFNGAPSLREPSCLVQLSDVATFTSFRQIYDSKFLRERIPLASSRLQRRHVGCCSPFNMATRISLRSGELRAFFISSVAALSKRPDSSLSMPRLALVLAWQQTRKFPLFRIAIDIQGIGHQLEFLEPLLSQAMSVLLCLPWHLANLEKCGNA